MIYEYNGIHAHFLKLSHLFRNVTSESKGILLTCSLNGKYDEH